MDELRVVTHMNETYITHMNETYDTYEWVVFRIWMSYELHHLHMDELRVITHMPRTETWLMHMCDMTYLYMCDMVTYSYMWDMVIIHTCHERRKLDLKSLQLPECTTSFHGSPVLIRQFIHGSPENFKRVVTWVNGVPVTQKIYQENWSIWRSKYLKSDLFCERNVT